MTFIEMGLSGTLVCSSEPTTVEVVILHCWEEDVLSVEFLLGMSGCIVSIIPLGIDVIDLSLLIVDNYWLSVIVLDMSGMVVLLWVIVLLSWLRVMEI